MQLKDFQVPFVKSRERVKASNELTFANADISLNDWFFNFMSMTGIYEDDDLLIYLFS